MKIGIIGAGNVGGTLGKRFAGAGYPVIYGTRDAQSDKTQALLAQTGGDVSAMDNAQVAQQADVLVITLPANAVEQVLPQLGDVTGKVVMDATNDASGQRSMLATIQQALPGAHVVKAFSTIGVEVMADPTFGDQNATLFIVGDDAPAKQTVAQIAHAIGFDVVDMGGSDNAIMLEQWLLRLWFALSQQFGRHVAIRVLRDDAP